MTAVIPQQVPVALRKESVDRNGLTIRARFALMIVALRKESVDRNTFCAQGAGSERGVALRKESVDRNTVNTLTYRLYDWSLSARRAWIEILIPAS